MEPIQFILIGVSVALTTLMVFLGVQIYYILKEFRRTIQKINKMLDDMGKVSGTVGDGVSNFSSIVQGLKTGLNVFTTLRKKGEDYE